MTGAFSGGDIASIIVALVAVVAAEASRRAARAASSKDARSAREDEAYERARAIDTATIQRQESELAELRELVPQLERELRAVRDRLSRCELQLRREDRS